MSDELNSALNKALLILEKSEAHLRSALRELKELRAEAERSEMMLTSRVIDRLDRVELLIGGVR